MNDNNASSSNLYLADIWSDTVDLRHMAGAMAIALTLGISCFIGSQQLLTANLVGVAKNLIQAYALLGGIFGCLLAAFISARLFKPKRTINESEFTEEDRQNVINELQIDLEEEAKELENLPADVVDEMKQLKIYDLFARPNQKENV